MKCDDVFAVRAYTRSLTFACREITHISYIKIENGRLYRREKQFSGGKAVLS